MKPVLDFGFIQIPTFYLVISLSVTFVLLLINSELNKNPKIDRKMTFDIVLIAMVTGFIGARLTHVFYEEWNFYSEFPLEIFKFWKGGFVFYGGFIVGLYACIKYVRSKKENVYFWSDFFTPYLSLSYALGRIGCFFEGCCFGTHCNLPWSINGRHPTQLYMVFAELFLLALLLLSKKNKPQFFKQPGIMFYTWLAGHALTRFIIEFYREDDRGALVENLSISQWISLVFLFLGFTAIIELKRRKQNQ